MIYVDTSVVLAEILSEDRRPPVAFWRERLTASRLVQYEAWNRIHARGLSASLGTPLESLLSRIAFLELVRPVLARALDPYPSPLRTLDALHLASASFLLAHGQVVKLATYDDRMRAAAKQLGISLFDLA